MYVPDLRFGFICGLPSILLSLFSYSEHNWSNYVTKTLGARLGFFFVVLKTVLIRPVNIVKCISAINGKTGHDFF